MKKRIILLLCSAILAVTFIGCGNKETNTATDSVDQQEEFLDMDVAAMELSGSGIVMAPVTLLENTYGVEIIDRGEHAWTLSYGDQELYLPINQNVVSYGGIDYTLSESSFLKDDILYADIRTLSELIGYSLSVSMGEDNTFTYAVAIKNDEKSEDFQEDTLKEEVLKNPEIKYAVSDIYMRDAASAMAQIIDVVDQYSQVTVTSQKGDWCGVNYNDKSGFIRSEYLTNNKPTDEQISFLENRLKLEEITITQGDKQAILAFQDIENIYRNGTCAKDSNFGQKSMNYWGYINVSREMKDQNDNPAWMYFCINSWYLGQASESEKLYVEMTELTKQAFNACLGENGNTLFDTVNQLISDYGNTYNVPSQELMQLSNHSVKIEHSDSDGFQIFIY